MKKLQRVFNLSGGKTSAYMTIKYYQPGDIVIFCDTGREHPKTYKFLNDFEVNENIPIIRLGNKDSFNNYLQKRKYQHIPNRLKRSCTIILKIKPARRHMRSLKLMEYVNIIGFRADEQERVKKTKQRWKKVITWFPLYEDGITKEFINDFWSKKNYNLEIPSILGNCTLCFMKGKNAIISILREFPELANIWIEDEKISATHFGHTYFSNVTIEELKNIAQNNLFKDYKLEDINPAFNCACTSV